MKILRISAIVLLVLVAINALVAGYLFMSDPRGTPMGISTELLKYTSFTSFFVPGLVLFIVNGLFALFTALAMIRFWPFCAFLLFCQGVLLSGWILIQVILLREFNMLHASLGLIGLFFVAVGLLLMGKPKRRSGFRDA